MSPFEGYNGGDLNRCFPGKPDGALTEQMAHAIYDGLRAHATHFVDFHTALTADTRWALFATAPGEVGGKAEGMARAFGFKHTLPAPMDILGGSAMMAAAKRRDPGPDRRGRRDRPRLRAGDGAGTRPSACATCCGISACCPGPPTDHGGL